MDVSKAGIAFAGLVLFAVPALSAKDPASYDKGLLLSMDSMSCGFAEKDGKTITGEILGTDSAHKKYTGSSLPGVRAAIGSCRLPHSPQRLKTSDSLAGRGNSRVQNPQGRHGASRPRKRQEGSRVHRRIHAAAREREGSQKQPVACQPEESAASFTSPGGWRKTSVLQLSYSCLMP